MKKFLIVLCGVFLVCLTFGCGKEEKTNELQNILDDNNYMILDVRTKEEYDEGHVVGAVNIPYDKIDEKLDLDKKKTMIVYCQSGSRSKIAYDTLISMGYNVYDLGAYDSITLDKE